MPNLPNQNLKVVYCSKCNKNIKVVYFGTPDFVIPVIQSLNEHFDLVAIITAPDKQTGRQQVLTPSPVKLAFPDKKIFTPDKLNEDFVKELQNFEPDLFVVGAYGKIIPQAVLDIPKFGSINIHPSLLPKYRGATPLQNTILNGDEKSAVSLILMDAEMDHGPIISTIPFRLSKQDNLQTLSNKVWLEVSTKIPQILQDFVEGELTPTPQNHQEATYTKILTKEDGFIDIDSPPATEELDRMIRAYFPWPTVWTKWNGKIIKLLPDQMVQMEGKKPIKLTQFLNGYPNFPLKEL